jgi:predicted ester cyclase
MRCGTRIAEIFEQTPDLAFEQQAVHFGEEHFVTRYVLSGTTFGRRIVCEGVDVFTVRDDKIVRKDSYVDMAKYFRQLGPLGFGRAAIHGVSAKLKR